MAAEKIQLETIVSSNLAAIGYNPEKQIVAVQFHDGKIFHHSPFPPEDATAFYGAESRGSYYAKNIRGKVAGQRMTGPCPHCSDEGWIGEQCSDCGTARYEEFRRCQSQDGGKHCTLGEGHEGKHRNNRKEWS